MTNVERIREWAAEGKPVKIIRALLTIEGLGIKEIKALIEEAGILNSSAPRAGFKAAYYAFLAEKKRTEEEAIDFIEGRGEYGETSPNIMKNKANFIGVWGLSVAIFEGKGEPEQEAEEDLSEEEAKAYKVYEEVLAKFNSGNFTKRDRNRIHPDKVNTLSDKIKDLYSELFKKMS